jgi:hypothetical protein
MVRRLTTIATLTAFVSTLTTPAFAQRRRPPRGQQAQPTPQPEDPTIAEARREYDQGRQLLLNNQPAEALPHFERAYQLRSNPIVLLPIAQSQVALGRIADAIATYERYLRERADAPDRAQIEQQLAELRRRPATVHVESTPPGGRIVIDGRDTGQVTPADVPVDPGHHAVRIELSGHTAHASEFDAPPGGRVEVTGTLAAEAPSTPTPPPETTPPPEATPPPAPPEERRTSPAVWVAAGLTGAGVVAGTVFGFMALGELSEFNARPSVEVRDRGETYALLSDISFGVAVLSAAVGAVVFFSDRGESAEPARAALRLRSSQQPRLRVAPAGFVLTF